MRGPTLLRGHPTSMRHTITEPLRRALTSRRARRESGHPSMSSALLKNRGTLQSNCLTNYLLQVCSGFPSLTYPPNSFGPQTRVQRVRVHAESNAGRFWCGFAKGCALLHRDLAGWAAAPRTLPWGPSPPPAALPQAPRRRRRTSSPPPPPAPRRPHHLAVAAVGAEDNDTGLAAAAGPRHLAAGADPSPNRLREVFSDRWSGHISGFMPPPPNHVAAARPAAAPAPRRRRLGGGPKPRRRRAYRTLAVRRPRHILGPPSSVRVTPPLPSGPLATEPRCALPARPTPGAPPPASGSPRTLRAACLSTRRCPPLHPDRARLSTRRCPTADPHPDGQKIMRRRRGGAGGGPRRREGR